MKVSQGHYPPIYQQTGKGFIYLIVNNRPNNAFYPKLENVRPKFSRALLFNDVAQKTYMSMAHERKGLRTCQGWANLGEMEG